uniref:Fatty acid binding protein 10b, liver basic n=1 Tax=Amphilophus citrinellus TaxID=61819 RepID=A0A3Q0QWS9_AMPCI
MDFNGTWKVYSEENLEEFLKIVGAPEMVIKMRKDVKPVIIIEQKGKDFTYTIKTPVFTKVHSFSLGKEIEMMTIDGRKIKCTVREENGKLIAENDKFTSVREIQGDEMIEVGCFKSPQHFSELSFNVTQPCSRFVSAYSLFPDSHCWLCNLHQQKQTSLTRQLMDPSS